MCQIISRPQSDPSPDVAATFKLRISPAATLCPRLTLGMLTFRSQVPDLTLLTLFNPNHSWHYSGARWPRPFLFHAPCSLRPACEITTSLPTQVPATTNFNPSTLNPQRIPHVTDKMTDNDS